VCAHRRSTETIELKPRMCPNPHRVLALEAEVAAMPALKKHVEDYKQRVAASASEVSRTETVFPPQLAPQLSAMLARAVASLCCAPVPLFLADPRAEEGARAARQGGGRDGGAAPQPRPGNRTPPAAGARPSAGLFLLEMRPPFVRAQRDVRACDRNWPRRRNATRHRMPAWAWARRS
jgi:hypothetical protein